MIRHLLAAAVVCAAAAPASAQATKFLGKDRADWAKELGDASPAVRRGAAFALGKIGNEREAERLARALRDDDATVRAAAATALGDIVVRPGQGTGNSWRAAAPEPKRLLERDD